MRVGFNPNKDKELLQSDFFHQIIIPVYIPNQEEYFKDSFNVLKLCLQSLFKTTHDKTYFTIINNGSCEEVVAYLNTLHQQEKIHEIIHTTAIGKLNAILKGVSGHSFSLVTITDADVLFLNNWQQASYDVFEAFPKAGAVSTTPSSKVLKQYTAHLLISKLFSKKLQFVNVINPYAMINFAKSIGNPNFYNETHLKKYLTLSKGTTKAVVGAGHFVATYRGSVFDTVKYTHSSFALGGNSEVLLLDKPVDDLGYWRLSTSENYTYHMGNVKEVWMDDEIEKLKERNNEYKDLSFSFTNRREFNFFKLNSILFKLLSYRPIWRLFLRYKGLTKEEAKNY
jgi:hypothetical protein